MQGFELSTATAALIPLLALLAQLSALPFSLDCLSFASEPFQGFASGRVTFVLGVVSGTRKRKYKVQMQQS